MKMAKASQADLDMANELAWLLEALEKRCLPEVLSEQFGDDEFDIDNPEHVREAMGLILRTLRKGSLFRVTFGMLVLLDSDNEIVDPDARTLEVHPKFERCEQARQHLEAVVRRLVDIMERSDLDKSVSAGHPLPTLKEWNEAMHEARAVLLGKTGEPMFLGEFRP
ncbi:MAG: hypothetical protein H3C26_20275 [Rhodocyclaceae bacterium]|nr:hypothetical protein [Rhodocyclaceae bacterium]